MAKKSCKFLCLHLYIFHFPHIFLLQISTSFLYCSTVSYIVTNIKIMFWIVSFFTKVTSKSKLIMCGYKENTYEICYTGRIALLCLHIHKWVLHSALPNQNLLHSNSFPIYFLQLEFALYIYSQYMSLHALFLILTVMGTFSLISFFLVFPANI